MKFSVILDVKKTEGPQQDWGQVADELESELDTLEVWVGDSGYEVTSYALEALNQVGKP